MKDTDKCRDELIKEIGALRDHNSRLKEVVSRYERVVSKKDLLQSRYDAEVERDSLDAMREELREKQKTADVAGEELVIQNEELALQLEEINVRSAELDRANRALRDSEERYRALVETSPDAIIVHDGERYLYANPAALALHGADTFDQLRRHKVTDIIHPDDRALIEARIRRMKDGDMGTLQEARLIRLDGRQVFFESTGTKINYGEGKAYQIIIRDITERKRIEEALRESEARLKAEDAIRLAGAYNRSLIEASLDPLVTIAPDGRITDVNKATEEATGYPREQLIGTDFSNYFTEPGIAKEGYLKVFKESTVKDYPLEIRHRDGHITSVLYNASVYKDDAGKVIGVFAAARDVTERRRAEKELDNYQRHLEDLVRERTQDLECAKAHAELYLDLMGHDINNMHQIALGYLELALSMPPGVQHDEMIEKPIEVLQRSAQLIRNVRKLQKHNEGIFQSREVDVVDILWGVRREFGAVPGKTVTLNMNGNKHCYVLANELLHDVFANLVSNAIKHTGERADISIALDFEGENGGRHCRVSVEDNGPGIPDGFKSVIFNRVLKGTKRAKGMGLGLYLVKSLVDSYGGRVWVEDRIPGDFAKGARFVVLLPTAGE